jgi:hypothetical protein
MHVAVCTIIEAPSFLFSTDRMVAVGYRSKGSLVILLLNRSIADGTRTQNFNLFSLTPVHASGPACSVLVRPS